MIEKISDFIISILPSSALFYIIFLFSIAILSLVLIMFFAKKSKKKHKANPNKDNKKITFEMLKEIVNNKNATSKDLASALILFSENFDIKGNEKDAFEFFKKVLNHKNRDKNLFKIYQEKIVSKYKSFESQLNEIEKKALNK